MSWSLESMCGVNKMQRNLTWMQSGNETRPDARMESITEGQSASTQLPRFNPNNYFILTQAVDPTVDFQIASLKV